MTSIRVWLFTQWFSTWSFEVSRIVQSWPCSHCLLPKLPLAGFDLAVFGVLVLHSTICLGRYGCFVLSLKNWSGDLNLREINVSIHLLFTVKNANIPIKITIEITSVLNRTNVECATNVTVWICWVTCKTVRRYYSRMHRGSQGVLIVRESLVVAESAVLSAVYVEQWYKYTTVVHGLVAATHLVTRRRSNSALYAMLQETLTMGHCVKPGEYPGLRVPHPEGTPPRVGTSHKPASLITTCGTVGS